MECLTSEATRLLEADFELFFYLSLEIDGDTSCEDFIFLHLAENVNMNIQYVTFPSGILNFLSSILQFALMIIFEKFTICPMEMGQILTYFWKTYSEQLYVAT